MANRWKNRLTDRDVTPESVYLNRRQWMAGAAGAVALGKWLQNPQCHLRELNVAWNEFRAPGGLAVLQGALANTNLRKLDLSWNGIGSGSKNTEALDMLQQVIRHSMLLHLSLTHNSFTKDALDQIGHAILQSEYLVAVHVEQPNEVGHPLFSPASTRIRMMGVLPHLVAVHVEQPNEVGHPLFGQASTPD